MCKNPAPSRNGKLIRGVVICALLLPAAFANSGVAAQKPADAGASASAAQGSTAMGSQRIVPPVSSVPRRVTPMSSHARDHYQLVWGVDSLDVKAVESGQMIRFSYYVLDSAKATQLNDKKANPFLIDEQARVKLEIPTMEKVGQLRQSSPPEAGKSYWMVFSNKGGVVKPGDRVSIVIGKFRADGLYVR
jgi:hypothetical protein